MTSAWLRFAWLNTLRNRRRSLITVAIAALGTAGILLAGGFALYTYESLAQASARTTGHLVIAKADQFLLDEDTPPAARPRRRARADRQVAGRPQRAPGAAACGVQRPHQQWRQIHRDGGRRHRARCRVRGQGTVSHRQGGRGTCQQSTSSRDAGRRPGTQPQGHAGQQPHAAGQHHRRRAQCDGRHRAGRLHHGHPGDGPAPRLHRHRHRTAAAGDAARIQPRGLPGPHGSHRPRRRPAGKPRCPR